MNDSETLVKGGSVSNWSANDSETGRLPGATFPCLQSDIQPPSSSYLREANRLVS